jgi:sugar phosphate permease
LINTGEKFSVRAVAGTVPSGTVPAYSWYVLGVLFAVNAFNFVDRQILAILQEGIKHDLVLSDTQLGFLSTGFSIFYVVAGFPIAYLADRSVKSSIVSLGICARSLLTVGCGLARNFWQLARGRGLIPSAPCLT